MRTWIKVTIGFTAGLATGALVTHLYYKETIDNTVDRKVFTILGEQNKDKKKKDIKVDQILSTHLPTQPKELDISNIPAGTIDYTKFYEQANPEAVAYPSEDEDYIHDDLEGASMTMDHQEAIKKGPRLLTYEEFHQPTNNIIKQLCFYPESGILTDMETEEEIEDSYGLVGDILVTSGFACSDEMDSTVLVANDALGEWYEITKAY